MYWESVRPLCTETCVGSSDAYQTDLPLARNTALLFWSRCWKFFSENLIMYEMGFHRLHHRCKITVTLVLIDVKRYKIFINWTGLWFINCTKVTINSAYNTSLLKQLYIKFKLLGRLGRVFIPGKCHWFPWLPITISTLDWFHLFLMIEKAISGIHFRSDGYVICTLYIYELNNNKDITLYTSTKLKHYKRTFNIMVPMCIFWELCL